MPLTSPSRVLVASSDSPRGICRLTWLRPLRMSPTANSEKPALVSVSQSASAAAIFIGCCSVMICAVTCPLSDTTIVAISAVAKPSRAVLRKASRCGPRRIDQTLIAPTKVPATRKPPAIVCG